MICSVEVAGNPGRRSGCAVGCVALAFLHRDVHLFSSVSTFWQLLRNNSLHASVLAFWQLVTLQFLKFVPQSGSAFAYSIFFIAMFNSNKKLLETSASLLVTSALLVVTRS